MEALEEWNARPEVRGARLADPDMGAENRRIVPFCACPGVELVTLEGIVQPFPLHFHGFWTVGEIVRGRRRTTCRGEMRELGPGDLVLFGPGEVHGCRPVDGEPLFYRSVIVPDGLFASICGADGGAFRFDRFTVRDDELAAAMAAVYALAEDAAADALEQEEALVALVSRAASHGEGASDGGSPEPRVASAAVERVRDLLEERSAVGVSLAELAETAGLSRYHLVRVFAAETGLTPHRYLQAVRANRARDLLAQGVGPAEAAVRAGFSDQAHMTRVFKALFGLTPARYRAAAVERAGCTGCAGGVEGGR